MLAEKENLLLVGGTVDSYERVERLEQNNNSNNNNNNSHKAVAYDLV